jgi:hypothetical protein
VLCCAAYLRVGPFAVIRVTVHLAMSTQFDGSRRRRSTMYPTSQPWNLLRSRPSRAARAHLAQPRKPVLEHQTYRARKTQPRHETRHPQSSTAGLSRLRRALSIEVTTFRSAISCSTYQTRRRTAMHSLGALQPGPRHSLVAFNLTGPA